MSNILIIEDEKPMAEAIKFSLQREGHVVDLASDGDTGWRVFQRGGHDLIILDLMLPGIDGLEILKRVRQRGSTPVLVLTAKDSDVDKVVGLEMGADDFMTKPFNMREFLARVKTVMRRSDAAQVQKSELLQGGGVEIDVEAHQVTVRGKVVEIPPIEYRLLELFLKKKGRVFSREYLIAAGWRGEFYGQTKTLDVHISRLRERVEEDQSKPRLIVTVRGVGYRFSHL